MRLGSVSDCFFKYRHTKTKTRVINQVNVSLNTATCYEHRCHDCYLIGPDEIEPVLRRVEVDVDDGRKDRV